MKTYKYDTHVHTDETSSCAQIRASFLVNLYKEAGYQGIVITDHYTSEFFETFGNIPWKDKLNHFLFGYKNAALEGQKVDLNVILGMELRFEDSYNDYLIYGIDEDFLLQYPALYKLNLKKFRKLVKGKGILIYQAHPFRSWVTAADPKLLDGVEVYNGGLQFDSKNHLASVFASKNHLKIISGSDFHHTTELARGGIVLQEAVKNSREFAKLLQEDKIISLIQTP